MGTTFLVILTLIMFLQILLGTSSNTMMMTSSNVTCIERERESLLTFKRSITDRFNRLSTWAGVECCEWQGVWCDMRNGHVVELDLRSPFSFTYEDTTLNTSNWLRGEVNPSLLNLKHLRYLDLSLNNFSGRIPEFFGSFKYLEYLNLSYSGFSGVVPHHLGNLSRLQYLDLNCNLEVVPFFYGLFLGYFDFLMVKDDLRWLSSLSSLKYLDLSGIEIGDDIDWFHPVNTLPSLLTLNLASCDINLPSVKLINFTSLSSLDLSSNYINSTIPVWLSNLTGLVYLDLGGNNFHGRIPAEKLCNLSVLELSSNEFAGDFSSFFGNMSSDCLVYSLQYLNLGGNQFKGSIPNKIGEFKKLEHLILSENTLSGPIPPSLGGLSCLRELDFNTNQLNGTIPASFGQLSRLENLVLSFNKLSGNIPMSIWRLSNLQFLDVSNNSLVGVLSEIHFTKLKNLTNLWLSYNSLTMNVSSRWIPPFQLYGFDGSSCNVGPQFPSWLQKQTNLHRLYLSNSGIRDTLPQWFENILSNIFDLDLSYNQIRGNLPRFHSGNLLRSRYLLMNSNKFEGSIPSFPSNVWLLDLSDNLLSGHIPHTDGTMNPSLIAISLSKNHLTGSVPAHLCKVLSIMALDLSHNSFSGILPECLGSLINLRAIDLSNNTITGVIPSSLGSLSHLWSLHLHNNIFEGDIPASLQNLTELVTMDLGKNLLTGRIPFWIGELSHLKFLSLQSNQLIGIIPPRLCQLKALRVLNLAQNNIIGKIPSCFGNLSGLITDHIDSVSILDPLYEENIYAFFKGRQMLYTKTKRFLTSLDLSSNKIVGEIPDVLMNLVALKNLNLSRNQLKGQIPVMIGNLKQLESLDLSMNKLSGRIPQRLTSLNFLSYLNLSFNNLSGPIPFGNQLQTLNNPSNYEGNSRLCGPPLSRSCEENDPSYNHVGEDEGQDNTEGSWFYGCMGLGFAAGFIGLLGSLHFIRSWRIVYFQTLENVYRWLMLSFQLNLARLRRKFFK